MASFRKVIAGDAFVAAKYFSRARKMLASLAAKGKRKSTYADDEVIVLVTHAPPSRKAIFLVSGPLFMYTSEVTTTNIATFEGWFGIPFREVLSIDFNDLADPSKIASIEITEVIAGVGYIYLRSDQLLTEPPYSEYELTVSRTGASVGEVQEINYDGAAFNFRELHRGADRDFLYTTTDVPFVGADAGAAIHERLWSDETNLVTLRKTLPASLADFAWPFVGADDDWRYMQVNFNDIYITEAKSDFSQIYFWGLAGDGTWGTISTWNSLGFGGSSLYQYGSMLYNKVNTEMRISNSVWYDIAGNPSDEEQFRSIANGVPLELSFTPGDLIEDYPARTTSNETRINRCWCVATDTYAFHIENTNQPAALAEQIPDGVFLSRDGVVELVYQAGAGKVLKTPIVQASTPNIVLLGEEHRSDGLDARLILLDVLTGTYRIVSDTESSLPSAQFVR